jgi:hypothetical protein
LIPFHAFLRRLVLSKSCGKVVKSCSGSELARRWLKIGTMNGYIALKGNSPRKSKACMDTASISKQIHTETSIA